MGGILIAAGLVVMLTGAACGRRPSSPAWVIHTRVRRGACPAGNRISYAEQSLDEWRKER